MLIQVVSLPNMPVFKLFPLSHILPSPNMQIKSHSQLHGAFSDVQASRAVTLQILLHQLLKTISGDSPGILVSVGISFLCVSLIFPIKFKHS